MNFYLLMRSKKLLNYKKSKSLPYSRQFLDKSDFQAVNEVLKSDFLTQGKKVEIFEKLLKNKVGAKYASAVNSATSALHLACLAVGLKKNDVLWTVPNTFVASANCGLYCGAKIDFVDIELNYYNIDTEKLEKKLQNTSKINLPKVLVVVHLAGQPANLEKISYLKKKYKFKVIEDASHALGATRKNKKIGNCKFSDACIFSFHPVKPITTAEGGAVLTNDKKIHNIVEMLRTHGITKNREFFFNKKNDAGWYYEQQLLGFNYRMSDIHAALGISQLKKVKKFVDDRNRLAQNYNKILSHLPIELPKIEKGNKSSFHLYIIRIKNISKKTYNKIFNYLRKNKIFVNLHYMPIPNHPYYRKKFKFKNFPMSDIYSNSAFSIPIYYGLKIKDQNFVKAKLEQVMKKLKII